MKQRNIKWQDKSVIVIIKGEEESVISEEIITESVSNRPQMEDQETLEYESTKTTMCSYVSDHGNKIK